MRSASVQSVRLGIESIHDGVVELAGSEFRAVLEVSGTASPFDDEVRQEAMQAAFTGFLNALNYPVQIVVRANAVDVTRYVASVEERARQTADPRFVELARDHAEFVQGLVQQRTLLERRFYVVIPAESATRMRWQSFWRGRDARAFDDEPRREAASRQLAFRCEEVVTQLRRCELSARRLSDLELAQLYVACWSPERARSQRFRQQLDDYATLAVRGTGRSRETEAAHAAL